MKKSMSFFLITLMLFCMTACRENDDSVPVDDVDGYTSEKPDSGDMASPDQTSAGEDGQDEVIDEGDENNTPYSGPDYDHLDEADYSPLVGWWYPEGDLSSLYYYHITEDGNWYRFDRSPGVDAAEMDSGLVLPDGSSTSFFYAESQSTGVQYMIFLFDFDVITMEGDEGSETLYRME